MIPCQGELQRIRQPYSPGVRRLACFSVQSHCGAGKHSVEIAAAQLAQPGFRIFQFAQVGHHSLGCIAQTAICIARIDNGSFAVQGHNLVNIVDQFLYSLGCFRSFCVVRLVGFQLSLFMGNGQVFHDDFNTVIHIGSIFCVWRKLNQLFSSTPRSRVLVNIGLLGNLRTVDIVYNICNGHFFYQTVAVFHAKMIDFGSIVIFTVSTDLDTVNLLIGIVRIHQIQVRANSVKTGYQRITSACSGSGSHAIAHCDIQGTTKSRSAGPVCISFRNFCKRRHRFYSQVHFNNSGGCIRNGEIQLRSIGQLFRTIQVILFVGRFFHYALIAIRIQLDLPAIRIQIYCALSILHMGRKLCVNIRIKDQGSIPGRFHGADLDGEVISLGKVKDTELGKGNLYLFDTRSQSHLYTVDLQRCNGSFCCYVQISLIPGNTELACAQGNGPPVGGLIGQIHRTINGDGFFRIRRMKVVRINRILGILRQCRKSPRREQAHNQHQRHQECTHSLKLFHTHHLL